MNSLHDHDNSLVKVILIVYLLRNFISDGINQACMNRWTEKYQNLGAYSKILGHILGYAASNRVDIVNAGPPKPMILFRATVSTKEQ